MTFLVVILHILACISLILIVLLQAGKGADIGASMGGAGGQALFGTTGATTMLSKITTGIAVLFMLTSLYLAYQTGHVKESPSVMSDAVPVVEKTVPKEDVKNTNKTPVEATETEKTVPATPAAEKGSETPVTGVPENTKP